MPDVALTGKATALVRNRHGNSNWEDGRKKLSTVEARGKDKKEARAQHKLCSTVFPETAARAVNPPEIAAKASRESCHHT